MDRAGRAPGYVLGVNAMWHDASACLVAPDGRIVAAAEEERFSRVKDERRFPVAAIEFCLEEAGIGIDEVTHLALPRLAGAWIRHKMTWDLRNERSRLAVTRRNVRVARHIRIPARLLREAYRSAARLPDPVYVRHHAAHAASAVYGSPFEECAYLTLDGMGEWECSTWGRAAGTRLHPLGAIVYPHSLGCVYWAIARYLGLEGERPGKMMALASYGEPSFAPQFKNVLLPYGDGGYRINYDLFDFRFRQRVADDFETAIGMPSRHPDEPIEQQHKDLAATTQRAVEEAIFSMLRKLHRQTGLRRVVLAGGVALNSVANGKIQESTPFEEVFVPPAADDAGLAVGAAWYMLHHQAGRSRRPEMISAALGPDIAAMDIEVALRSFGDQVSWRVCEDIADTVAALLSEQRIVAWCQGRMEYGPRALGHRSILADPRRAQMSDALNRIKGREPYRPVAPAVVEEKASDWFEGTLPSPFMLFVGRVRAGRGDLIPAAAHVDGSARVQTVSKEGNELFHRLITAFGERTGVPVVLNTSFNGRGEPICCTAQDAIGSFLTLGIDALALGPYLVERR